MSASDPQGPADEALDRAAAAFRATAELLLLPGLIGLDFHDVRGVLERAEDGSGRIAIFGEGLAEGEDRALRAAEAAIADLLGQLRALRGGP